MMDDAFAAKAATEALGALSDDDLNRVIEAEKNRRKYTAKTVPVKTKVQFVKTTRPKRLAGATGHIVDLDWSGGEWKYKIKVDGTNETFIRITRSSFNVVDADVHQPAGPKKQSYAKSSWNF